MLDSLTKIHSLVIRDISTDTVLSFADQPGYQSIAAGLEALANADLIVGHNCIKFDIPAILKLYPAWKLEDGIVRDTLVLTRYLWAHIEEGDYGRAHAGKLPKKLIGSHSLEAWGYRLGVLKGDYGKQKGAWAEWSVDMQRYCENDTLVTKTLYNRTQDEVITQGSAEPVELEHNLAWYLAQMERNGVPFDMEKAIALQATLAARREEVRAELVREFGSWFASNGVTNPKRSNQRKGSYAGAPYTKTKLVEFNPSSRDHTAKVLKERYGWIPKDFTDGGRPKVDETTLEGLAHIPAAAKVIEYLLVTKRLGQLAEGHQEKAWMAAATNAGAEGGKLTGLYHIHGSVNQNGAVTHRATHSRPNLAQVPRVGSPYGQECRELFYVPKGWTMLGADAAGLELRCLAHYMAKYDEGAYGRLILDGDVHSANRDALGLEGKAGRDVAKTFIYAWLYGAGAWKIGHILDPLAADDAKEGLGKRKKAQFLKNTPALKMLSEAAKAAAEGPHYIRMPDGRRSYIRHAHAALNTLLQGAGAIICKAWIVEFSRRMTTRFGPQGWGGDWAALLWIHDEIEVAVRLDIAEEAQQIAVESIRSITEHFKWRLPLDGEARLGGTWASVH